ISAKSRCRVGKGARMEDSLSLHKPNRVRRAHALRTRDAWVNARNGAYVLKHHCARLPTLLVRQRVPPLRGIALEATLATELLQREHDLAPVVAPERGHQVREELGPVPQRRLDRCKLRPFEGRRLRNFRLEGARTAGRQREIVARLGAGGGVAERGIERQGAEAVLDHRSEERRVGKEWTCRCSS